MSDEVMGYIERDDADVIETCVSPRREVRAVLICKNPLLQAGLKHYLTGSSFSVSEAQGGVSSLEPIYSGRAPALFIVGAGGASDDVVGIVTRLKAEWPHVRVVIVTSNFDVDIVTQALEVGVDGLCHSESSRDTLIKSLELVMLGEMVLPRSLAHSLLSRRTTRHSAPDLNLGTPGSNAFDTEGHKLSTREAEILKSLMSGASNKLIARNLDVAEATVKAHIKSILRKIGATNRTQAAMWATEHLPVMGEQAQKGMTSAVR